MAQNITISVSYSDIISRATMLSAFEAKESAAAEGGKGFSDLRITDKDGDAVKAYIQEGVSIIDARLSKNFDVTSSESGDTLTWTLSDETSRRSKDGFEKGVKEALVCFALSRWFENKLPNSSSSYKSMFSDLSEAAIRTIITKHKPKRPTES